MEGQRYKQLGKDSKVELGHGSYATVVPAWDTKEDRLVAVKIQKRDCDTVVREMFFF